MPEYTDHFAPQGLRTRGTVLVVPGRGETRTTYDRFGRRLAADAYRVRVLDAPELDPDDLTGTLDRLAAQLGAAADGTATDDGIVRPVVVVGSDTGAALVAALVGRSTPADAPHADAVVLAGLPGRTATEATDVDSWDGELDVRTSCPAHRRTLTDDSQVRRGALNDTVPEPLLTAALDADLAVPTLILTGDADPLADRDELHRTAKSLGRARLSVVRGAHHDVLNDLQHRSVAAEVVTFLETLREDLVPLVTVETSAW